MFKAHLSTTTVCGGVLGPLRHGLDTKATVFTWKHYHGHAGQFIIGAVFKKGTRRDPDSFLDLLSGPR